MVWHWKHAKPKIKWDTIIFGLNALGSKNCQIEDSTIQQLSDGLAGIPDAIIFNLDGLGLETCQIEDFTVTRMPLIFQKHSKSKI